MPSGCCMRLVISNLYLLSPPAAFGYTKHDSSRASGETRALMQCRNPGPLFLPPLMGEG